MYWLPNLFIAGAPKSGTSSMHAWIADHPDAFGSVEKETYFFVDPGTHMHRPSFNITNGLESYRAQFPVPDDRRPKVILEATPSYIYNVAALRHIPNLASRPLCLFMLREPAKQIYSLYTYFRGNWDWIPFDMSFGEFLTAAREGSHDFKGNELACHALDYARYVDYLEGWRSELGAERIMVVTFDELVEDEVGLTKRVASWAGLDPSFYDSYDFPRENETYAPVNRSLQGANIALRRFLPKGRAYEALRTVYRRLNTRRPDGPGEQEAALMDDLKSSFTASNDRLARMFGLDLTAWS